MSFRPPSSRAVGRARLVACGAGAVLAACALASCALAFGDPRSERAQVRGASGARAHERDLVITRSARDAASLPTERAGRCVRTEVLVAQGAACRTVEGLLRLPIAAGQSITTHGPDPRPSAPPSSSARARASDTYGHRDDVVCGQASRGRTFLLVYAVPSDYRTSPSAVRRAPSRFGEVRAQLRQAAYDASHHIDLRASELAGSSRRMRFQCDPDGQPTVVRVVLPRPTSAYLSSRGAVVAGVRQSGFALMIADLTAKGVRTEYDLPFGGAKKMPAQRKVIVYYDGQFAAGVGGQGELIPIDQPSLAGTAWRGRTSRGIHNNQPYSMTAIQYGTAYSAGAADPAGTPDAPSFTTLLHESGHTMGAVQDGAPDSSSSGHCNDGLDIMCYADGGATSDYRDTVCPDQGGGLAPQDEVYDCGGDTYFHPKPSGWLAAHWNLAEPMNEFLARETAANPAPIAPTGLAATASGTTVRVQFDLLPQEHGVQYEVWQRIPPAAWTKVGTWSTSRGVLPGRKPRTTYEYAVAAADAAGNQGIAATTSVTTGADTTPPAAVRRPVAIGRQQHAVRIAWSRPTDNVAVVGYRLDRLVGSSWKPIRVVRATGATVRTPWIRGLASGVTHRFRIRAYDARGNLSAGVGLGVSTI